MGTHLADFYNERYGSEVEATSHLKIGNFRIPSNRHEAAAYFLRDRVRGDVIEFGAGDGAIADYLLSYSPGISSYTLSDLSAARVSGARRRLNDNRVQVLEMDVEKTPEELGGKFDVVIMVALIEHLIDPLAAMRNMKKLLKPGGVIYLDTPNIAKFTRRLKLAMGRFPSTASLDEGLRTYNGGPVLLHDEGHLHYFTYSSLSRMLTDYCGFVSVEKCGYPIMRPTRLRMALATFWPEMFSEVTLIARA